MTARDRIRAALRRLRSLVGRGRLERDLDDELRFHLAMREEHYEAAGLEPEAARLAAARRFGNELALKEECRDVWTFPRLETFVQDIRFAGRLLARNPGFTGVAVLSLALGIGGNVAMFGLVNAILLRPLPYPAADRLVRLTGFYPKGAVVALQERSRTMEVAGVGTDQEVNLTGHGEAVRVVSSTVSANLFAVLGRGAAVGRTFEAGEDRPGRDRLVVLSHALWQARFASDPAAVGRMVTVEGVDRQVVGVMPAGFHFPSGSTELWMPLRLDPGDQDSYWGFGWMPMVARLGPGVTVAQARDDLRSLVPQVAALFPWRTPTWNADATVVTLQENLVRDLRGKLLVLQAAVGIVLLIACANVASLLLARAAARRKEIALRAALGASRGRILRQLVTESLALSALGGGLGVLLAAAARSGWPAILPADASGFPLGSLDVRVLGFVALLSALSGLFFGLAPAASAARVDLTAAIRSGGQRATGKGGVRLRSAFIAAEVALAVVLAVGAGLLIRTLDGLMCADPGFRPEETLTVRVSPNPSACQERAACVALYDELLRRLRETSGISDVAAASAIPLRAEQPLLPVELDGHPLPATDAVAPLLWAAGVTPGYFRILRIPVLRGRGLEDTDGETTARVVVVSAATAQRFWPNEDPIGKRVRVAWDTDWRTVVGLVGDVRQYALSGRTPREIAGAMYMPYPQSVALDRQMPAAMALFARSSASPSEIAFRIRSLVASVNPDAPVSDVQSLDRVLSSSVAEPRSMMWLFAAFAGGALLLAAIGTYGVVSYSTAQRTYEIGVRMAVGATRGQIVSLVMGQSLRLVLAGLGLGLLAALLLGQGLSSFLYGVTARDPITFAAVAGLLVLTALLAGYVPSRRAATTDPVRALRVD